MSECLIYQLKPGKTVVSRITMVSGRCLTTSLQIGRLDSVKPAAIRLSGEWVDVVNLGGQVGEYREPSFSSLLYRQE